ncbi:MAG: metallophosphoesterase [Candidatus Omnitrophota bacterium]
MSATKQQQQSLRTSPRSKDVAQSSDGRTREVHQQPKILGDTKPSYVIIHLADIHIRDTGRDQFARACEHLRACIAGIRKQVGTSARIIVCVVGDVFHYRVSLSSENITDCHKFLDCVMEETDDVVIIPGNHDANVHNHDRNDLLNPIMSREIQLRATYDADASCHLHYWSESGWHDDLYADIEFYAFSPLDAVAREPGPSPSQASASASGGPIWRIALVHDFIAGVKVKAPDGTARAYPSSIKREWMRPFHMVLCGHVHDYQYTNYLDGPLHTSDPPARHEQIIAYSGALTQLTIGETYIKGFIVWGLTKPPTSAPDNFTITHTFIHVPIPGAQVKYTVTQARAICNRSAMDVEGNAACSSGATSSSRTGAQIMPSDASRVVIDVRRGVPRDSRAIQEVHAEIERASYDSARVEIDAPVEIGADKPLCADALQSIVRASSASRESIEMQNDLIVDKLRATHADIDRETVDAVLALHAEVMTQASEESAPGRGSSAPRWTIDYLEWENLFCYANGNFINFDGMTGLVGLVADNRRGKSAVIDIMCLILFNHALRGSAMTTIRRGQPGAYMHCIWHTTETGSRICKYELTRRWNLRGHNDMLYMIDGANKTCDTITKTYELVAQTIGTFEDFVATSLVPQYDGETFISATDTGKREMLTRVIGLDVIDSAMDIAKSRIRELGATINAHSVVAQGISAQISKIATAHSCDVSRLMNGDDGELREIVKKAQVCIEETSAELSELEKMPAVVCPTKTKDMLERKIRDLQQIIASTRADIEREEKTRADKTKARDEKAREIVAAIRATTSLSSNTSTYEEVNARIADISSHLDQEAILLSHANEGTRGCKLEDVDARIEATAERIINLRKVRDTVVEIDTLRAEMARVREQLIKLEKSAQASSSSSSSSSSMNVLMPTGWVAPANDEELTMRRAHLIELIDKALPRACKCHGHAWGQSQDSRESMMRTIECATFAAGVALEPNDSRTISECAGDIACAIAQVKKETTRDPMDSRPVSLTDVYPITLKVARDAIRMVRLCSASANSSSGAKREHVAIDDVRYCIANHDNIIVNEQHIAALALLDKWERAHVIEVARNETMRNIKAMQDEIARIDARIASLRASDSSTLAHLLDSSVAQIDRDIRASESAHATLVTLSKHADAIRAVRAANVEIAKLREIAKMQRDIAHIDEEICAATRAIERANDIVRAREHDVTELEGERTTVDEKTRVYNEYVKRVEKIRAMRADLTRKNATYATLIAELDSFARIRDSAHKANEKIASAQLARHICELYAMTVDAKSGIQYSLFAGILERIEAEANALLVPVAQLQLIITAGDSKTAHGQTKSSRASSTTAAAAMVGSKVSRNICIFVRNTVTGVEHDASLCSGFQRFIINMAMRRAFSRMSVRPTADFMIIDEGFGCLDCDNTMRLCEKLPELADKFRFLLIVSHIDSLNAQVGTLIPITLRGATSEIQVGANIAHSSMARIPLDARASTSCPTPATQSVTKHKTSKISGASSTSRARVGPTDGESMTRPDGTTFCLVCNKDYTVWAKHIGSVRHKKAIEARE